MSQLTPARRRLALFALALGGFGIGCTEFASMGLLPQIAQNLLPDLYGASSETGIARAGWLVSAYAIGVVVGAPVISFFAAKSSRTTMLLVMAAALLMGNLASAIVPTFESLLVMRFLAGIPHGAYFGLASLVVTHDTEFIPLADACVSMQDGRLDTEQATTASGRAAATVA